MPEEQSTNLEPESDVQRSASNDDAPRKSTPAVDVNLTSTSKSDSPKPSSSQQESLDAQTNRQTPKFASKEPASTHTKPAKTPSRTESKSSEENTGGFKRGAPKESASTNTASEGKSIETTSRRESQPSVDSLSDSKQVVSKEPASANTTSKRKPTQTPSKTESQSSANSPGGSKIEAAFFQVLGLINKIVSPIFSTLRKALVESKLYSNLQDRFKPLQPIFRFFSWIWKQIIVGIVGNIIIKPLWSLVLKFLRGRFPDALKAFSDRFLTIVSVSLLAVVYWLFSSLMSATSSQPAVQKTPAPVATAPQPGPTAPPVQPAPVDEAPVIEEPPPLEPEQKQIIDVQTQVAEVFDRYSQDLVQSVQANFQAERLVIKVSDRWFDLPRTEQNQLGTDVLERSRKLEFPKLEIRDQKDELLAREPVVGSNIIVLQRRTAPAEVAIDNPA